MPEFIEDPATGEDDPPSCECGRKMQWNEMAGAYECPSCKYQECEDERDY